MELIKPIDNKSTYGITKDGRVWSFPCSARNNTHNGKWLKLSTDKDGYKIVNLARLSEKRNKRVHRLVAEAFLSNERNLPQVNHIDGCKTNNNIENLEWCDPLHNSRHAIENNLSNRGKKQKRNTSGYIGVSKNYKKWVASITVNREVKNIGSFYDKIEAAKAYDEASLKYHKNTGRLNFPPKEQP